MPEEDVVDVMMVCECCRKSFCCNGWGSGAGDDDAMTTGGKLNIGHVKCDMQIRVSQSFNLNITVPEDDNGVANDLRW